MGEPQTTSTLSRFVLYRRKPPETHTLGGYANDPGDPQLEGVEFTDGTVAVRWLTPLRSTSIWPDFATFDKVHGHPEYDSELVWIEPSAWCKDPAHVAVKKRCTWDKLDASECRADARHKADSP